MQVSIDRVRSSTYLAGGPIHLHNRYITVKLYDAKMANKQDEKVFFIRNSSLVKTFPARQKSANYGANGSRNRRRKKEEEIRRRVLT